jgi:hypothetical protein
MRDGDTFKDPTIVIKVDIFFSENLVSYLRLWSVRPHRSTPDSATTRFRNGYTIQER